MKNTFTFKLPSGVEAEVKPLLGKHQRWITEQGSTNISKNLNKVLEDILIRVGSEKNIDDKFVSNMLAIDRKFVLISVRQFTLGNPKTFEFNYEYKSQNNEKLSQKFDVDISDGFKIKKLQIIYTDGATKKSKDADYKEYSEIKKEVEFTLPDSEQKVKIKLLDGIGEALGSTIPKNKRSSHSAILIRKPTILAPTKGEVNNIWIALNLDNLTINDIEYLRATIKEIEGSVDTEFMFDNPDEASGELEKITIDLLAQITFFFPSGAI